MAPISPPVEAGKGNKELPAYLANGVVGLRVRDNPLMAGMALLCGYSGVHPARKIEAAATVPYPLAGNIALNGVWLSDKPDQLEVLDQAYSFADGELTSRLSFRAGGTVADIEVLTFCCRHQPTLVAQEIAVRLRTAADLKLQAVVDTRAIYGCLETRTDKTPGTEARDFDGSLKWESEGGTAHAGIALVTQLLGDDGAERESPGGGDRSPLVTQYGVRARAGKLYRLRQIASLVPSVMDSEPHRQAERLAAWGADQGFERLRRANRAEWEVLWKGRILLHGAGRDWQRLADAAFYYMNASVHVSSAASTSMFGLATWHDYHYYYGHVMWDIETFSLPPIALMQPEAAEALLHYRLRMLAGARSNAQSCGRRGLQFPWESAPTSGQEATPSPGRSAWHEDHVSLDVALAFAAYAEMTGDENFGIDKAWPVLSGVADWIVSRAHRTRGGYAIRRSTGIAERKQATDNDAFTNLSARAVLVKACKMASRLGRPPGQEWQAIAAGLQLPMRGKLLLPHDDWRANEDKAATPAPLMAVFPLQSDLDPQVEQTTLAYFLKRAQDYIGSPMLSPLYGVWAARAGKRALALKLLEEGYARFTAGRFLQTLEYRPDKFPEQPMAGPFFANMGGFLMSLLLGFPRLKPEGPVGGWPKAKVMLPQGWTAIEVERLWLRGRPMRLMAEQGKMTRLTAV